MRLEINERENVQVVVPHLPEGLQSEVATAAIMKDMIRRLLLENGIREYVFWYYTPMALTFTEAFNRLLRSMTVWMSCQPSKVRTRGCLSWKDNFLSAIHREVFKEGR